jgi:tRNA G10  N-methylase Trm11
MSHSKKQNELGRLAVHPFPARMAPAVALKAVSGKRRKLTVLDPMSGSGTVLAAARAKGHYAIGVDLDPLAVLLSKVWCTSVDRAPVQKKREKFSYLQNVTCKPQEIHIQGMPILKQKGSSDIGLIL